MIFLYRILINIIFILSPLIIILRFFKKKEHPLRFKEKFCFFSKKRINGKIIWFHGASVGELQSIVPLLAKLERERDIKQILITSNTLSSTKIMKNLKFKKVVHQFFPIDTKFLSIKFLNYWKPSCAFFIDSEIWPNMILNLNKKKIPINLINGRMTKSSFKKWKILKKFSNHLFGKINLCLSSSKESKKFLEKLGVKKVKFIGNLKYTQLENEKVSIDNNFRKFILSKKYWCASSTHEPEERFCGLVHKKLKKKYRNLLTVIIPRHVERTQSIINSLKQLNLKVHTYDSNLNIKKDVDIYLVNSYGKTKSFFSLCKYVFLGGSIINRGGQNPLEAARFGCNILHGPNVSNFREIYKFLKKNKISTKISNERNAVKLLNKLFTRKSQSKRIQRKLNLIGNKVLNITYKEIKLCL